MWDMQFANGHVVQCYPTTVVILATNRQLQQCTSTGDDTMALLHLTMMAPMCVWEHAKLGPRMSSMLLLHDRGHGLAEYCSEIRQFFR